MSSELDGCVPGSRIGWFEGGACSRLGLPLTDEIDGAAGESRPSSMAGSCGPRRVGRWLPITELGAT